MSLAAVSTDEDRAVKAVEAVARLLLVEAFELEELDEMRQVAEDACEEAGWEPSEIDKERTRQLMGFALRLEVEKKTKDLRVIKAAFGNALAAAKVAGIDDPKGPVRSAFQSVETECNSSTFPFEHRHKCLRCKRAFLCNWTCSRAADWTEADKLSSGYDSICDGCEEET